MLKKILALLAMLYAAASFAAVDVNKATAAELDGVKGIGPTMSKRIIDERKKGDFKNWEDFISRVKGIGEGNAAKLSTEGLTVKGEEFKKASESKKDEKKAAKEEKKEAKADAKADKKDAKEAKKDAKEAKSDAKEAKKEAAEAKKEAKEAKAEAKDAKKDEKAAAAKPTASAKK